MTKGNQIISRETAELLASQAGFTGTSVRNETHFDQDGEPYAGMITVDGPKRQRLIINLLNGNITLSVGRGDFGNIGRQNIRVCNIDDAEEDDENVINMIRKACE